MRKTLAATLAAAGVLMLGAGSAHAATEVVTEADVTRAAENAPPTDNWMLYTRAGTPATAAVFQDGPGTPPAGTGSLGLTTGLGTDKVWLFNYDHVNKPLGDIDSMGYSTYRTAADNPAQVAALNLQVDVNGPAAGGFTTLVFEPIYNTGQGAITNNTWQSWDAYDDGDAIWWSSNPIPSAPDRDTFVSWDTIKAANPAAIIVGGVGVNQGSGNPNLANAADAFEFDGTLYDFERIKDSDGDGVEDGTDNCVNVPNPGQQNNDGDANGDACDTDDDNDGRIDAIDNCQFVANPGQENSDSDALGNACDPDDDNDGVLDGPDNCDITPNPDQKDTDNDGVGDECDATPGNSTCEVDGKGGLSTNPWAFFGLSAEYKSAKKGVTGDFVYFDAKTWTLIRATKITSLIVSGKTATIRGQVWHNGHYDTFKLDVTDNSKNGKTDTFKLTLSDGFTAQGTVRKGDVDIDCQKKGNGHDRDHDWDNWEHDWRSWDRD